MTKSTIVFLGLLIVASGSSGAALRNNGSASFAAFKDKQILSEARRVLERTDKTPPLSLTASDGQGLKLTSLDINAVIEGPLAFVEMKMEFFNPKNVEREGRFSVHLPPEATIARMAMKVNTTWQEAEVVSIRQGRTIYEDYLHVKQDPALMELDPAGKFEARVFPIPARAQKYLIVSYTQLISHSSPFYLELGGIAKSVKGKLRVSRNGQVVASKNIANQNLANLYHYRPHKQSGAWCRGKYCVVSAVVPQAKASRKSEMPLVIVFDTSASRMFLS